MTFSIAVGGSQPGGSGGDGTITVADDETTLPGISTLEFVSGATIADGGPGIAWVSISGGGGGNQIDIGNGNTQFTAEQLLFPEATLTDFGGGVISIAVDTGVLSGTTGSIGGNPLLAGAVESGTVDIAGATADMVVIVTPAIYPGDGVAWAGYIANAGTVTVNVTAIIAATPTASPYNVRLIG